MVTKVKDLIRKNLTRNPIIIKRRLQVEVATTKMIKAREAREEKEVAGDEAEEEATAVVEVEAEVLVERREGEVKPTPTTIMNQLVKCQTIRALTLITPTSPMAEAEVSVKTSQPTTNSTTKKTNTLIKVASEHQKLSSNSLHKVLLTKERSLTREKSQRSLANRRKAVTAHLNHSTQ
jgi:hypothetical protein